MKIRNYDKQIHPDKQHESEKCFDPNKTPLEIHQALIKIVNGNKDTFYIFDLIVQGCNYVSIAKNLGIAEATVCAATNALCKELGLRTSTHGGDVRSLQDYLLKLNRAYKESREDKTILNNHLTDI